MQWIKYSVCAAQSAPDGRYYLNNGDYHPETRAFVRVSTVDLVPINVTDVNDNGPVITTAGTQTVAENQTLVAALTSTDVDAIGTNPAIFSITGGADAALFQVVTAADGSQLLQFLTAPDYETNPHSYQVEVSAFDGVNTTTKTIAVNVTDVDGVTINGTSGKDTINATTTVAGQPFPTGEEDVVYGRAGNDTIDAAGGNDFIDGGAGADTLIGGPDADTFVFDLAALTPAQPGSAIFDRILDYNQGNTGIFNPAEGDTLDFSALLSAGSGQVRVLENANGTAAILQIDQDGAATGAHWTTIVQLDGVHAGDSVKIVLNGGATANITATVVDPTAFAQPSFELAAFAPGAGGWSSDNLYKRELADVNGDGMADIVGFGADGVYVSLATGDGHFAPSTVELPLFGTNAGWSSDDTYPRELADVNGDGMADIVGFGAAGVHVSLATGDGHFAPSTVELPAFGTNAGWSSDDTYPRELADVNGDGMADIVGFGAAGVYVSLATGDGHFAPSTFEVPLFGTNAGWSSNDTYPREVADVNGDGMADIVGFGADGVHVSLATGDGHFAPSTFELPAFGTNAGWSSDDTYPRELADVNGDGMADIVGFGAAGVHVSRHRRRAFRAIHLRSSTLRYERRLEQQ